MDKAYKNPDHHFKGVWKATPLHAKSGSDASAKFTYTFKNGVTWAPPAGTFSRYSKDSLSRMDEGNEIWFGKDGNSVPSRKTFLCELRNQGTPSKTVWRFDEVGHNHEARNEVKAFNENDVFATPKPERLLERILTLGSNDGDLVLDSFLGSGTTSAVAQKMGRKYIGIELGNHCYTHCLPRLKAVVDGEQGGISKAVNWQGGGGFRFYELAPSLLKKDNHGNWVISEKYNAEMLAAAMAKQEGFHYSPDSELFWKQGFSTEKSYIFTTTAHVTAEYIESINNEMKSEESLLICAATFDPSASRHSNILIKKIPQILFDRCEFGKDNYNLNIIDVPEVEEEK
jgi:adenine-specific DNA-methyltransferase